MSKLIEKIADIDNLEKAYQKAIRGKTKYDKEAIIFSKNLTHNLKTLSNKLLKGYYEFSGYMRFTVHEPKERIIDAPHFVDKVVQLAILFQIKDKVYRSFIYDSYACIDNKGTHKAVEKVSDMLKKSYWMYGDGTTIVKIDIRKFFYSIDRDILKTELKRLIDKKFNCEETFKVMCKIIDSAESISEKGLPLGNVLSQLEANIYMNIVDQYCKRVLGLKFYVRYADDIIIIVENKEKAKFLLNHLRIYIKNRLNLDLNEKKSKIFPIEQGVNAYGFKIYRTHRLLRNDSKKVIKRKSKKMPRLLKEMRISQEKVEQIFNSWHGHARFGDSYNFMNKLIEKRGYIYLNRKGVIKVDMSKIFYVR